MGASIGLQLNHKGELSIGPSVGIIGSKSFEDGSSTTERKWSIDMRINGNSFFEAFSESTVVNSVKVSLYPKIRLWDYKNSVWGETIETYHKQLGIYRIEAEGYNPGNYYSTSGSTHAVFALAGDGETEAGTVYYPAIPSPNNDQFYRNEEQFRIKVIINPDYLDKIFISTIKANIHASLLDYAVTNPDLDPAIAWYYTDTTPVDYYNGNEFGEPIELSLDEDVPLYYEKKEESNVFVFSNPNPSYNPIAYQIDECADSHIIHLIYITKVDFKKLDCATFMMDSSDTNRIIMTDMAACLVEKKETGLRIAAQENTLESIDESCAILSWEAWKYDMFVKYINVDSSNGDMDYLPKVDISWDIPPIKVKRDPEDVYFTYDIEIKGPSIIAGEDEDQGIIFTGKAPERGNWEIEAKEGRKTLDYDFLTTAPYLYEEDLVINEIHLWDYDDTNADDSLGYPQEEYPENVDINEETNPMGEWEREPITIESSDFTDDVYISPELDCYDFTIKLLVGRIFCVLSKMKLIIIRQSKVFYGLDPTLAIGNEVEIICFDNEKEIYPDEYATYPVTLFNSDSEEKRMYLRPMSGNNEVRSRESAVWHTFFETGDSTVDFRWIYPSTGHLIELKPFESKKITALVGGWKNNRLNGLEGGVYPGDSAIHAMVLDIEDGDDIIQKSTGFSTTVVGYYGIDISCNNPFGSASPTIPARYDITVTNTGEMSERFELSYRYLDSEDGNLPSGWSTEFEKEGIPIGTIATGILDEGESTSYTLKVRAATIHAMQEEELEIKVISRVLNAYRAQGNILESVECSDELTTTTHTRALVVWGPEDIITFSKEFGTYVISRELEHVTGDIWKDPATGERFEYNTYENKWSSQETNEDFAWKVKESAWIPDSELRQIKGKNDSSGYLIELVMPSVDIDPDNGIIIIKEFVQVMEDGSSFYDPITGLTITIVPGSSPRQMDITDKDGNNRGTLRESETKPGLFTGTVDLDGDGDEESEIIVDTTTTPPTVIYFVDIPDAPPLPGLPIIVFPTYNVKIEAEPEGFTMASGPDGEYYRLYTFNQADSGNPYIDNDVVFDTMSLYYGFTFSELYGCLGDISGIDIDDLVGKKIYVQASQDMVINILDSKSGTEVQIRFETLRGDALFDVPDGEETWSQDIFMVIPYGISGVLGDPWNFCYAMDIIVVSETSVLVDGLGAIPFTTPFIDVVHGDCTYTVTNGKGSPLLNCMIINNEEYVAKDSVILCESMGHDDYFNQDDADEIKDFLDDRIGDSWTSPGSSPQEPFEEVRLTEPDDSDNDIRRGQSTSYSFAATYIEIPTNQIEAQIPVFSQPPARTTIYWEITGLPEDWEILLFDEDNTPVHRTTINNGETQNLLLQVIAADTAVEGETYTITIAANNSEGYEYDSFEVYVYVIVAEEIALETKEYSNEYVVTTGTISIDYGGVLCYDNTELIFDGSGLSLTVNDGGELMIRDSVIKSSNPAFPYPIIVNGGGRLTIENSTIYDVGDITGYDNGGIQLLTSGTDMVNIQYSKISGISGNGISISSGSPVIRWNDINLGDTPGGIAIDIGSGAHPMIESNNITITAETPPYNSIGVNLPSDHTGNIVLRGNHITGFHTGISLNRNINHAHNTEEISTNLLPGNEIGMAIGAGIEHVDILGNIFYENGVAIVSILSNDIDIGIFGGYIGSNIEQDFYLKSSGDLVNLTCFDVTSTFENAESIFKMLDIYTSLNYKVIVWYSMLVHVMDAVGYDVCEARVSMTGNGFSESCWTDETGQAIIRAKHYYQEMTPPVTRYNPYTLEVKKIDDEGNSNTYTEEDICMISPEMREVILNGYHAGTTNPC